MLPGDLELLLLSKDCVHYDQVVFGVFCEKQDAVGVAFADSIFPNGSAPRLVGYPYPGH